ncbi:MFS transporter [Robbsia sp. Bb-Pol-6]|uniref:MFS transporter n=1 Tax=Robbsia betulipollinis TaxID=2981849 RepID=A0ABT3ZLM6_9BURK|nr:MFS transporter [Robbsia betulipollinis]MCY0387242.1 MFS transporter [Robbsia betulipollinis]
MSHSHASSSRMSGLELRATLSLAAIFALRMLGLFMIMPVFSIYAKTIPGGDNAAAVGLAIGIYGLTQSLFYIPYGWLSDRIGRKPVIIAGLVVFALGSAIAALAHDMTWIIIGRAIQGAGAISSAITAFIADLTTEGNRTKAMAMVGGSIGVSFGVAIILAPVVFRWIGMSGLFSAIGVLAVLAIAVVIWVVPDAPTGPPVVRSPFSEVLHNPELLRMNFGVYALHATQTALFVVLPHMLELAGLPVASHWRVYLPVMGLSFVLMVPAIIVAEKRGRMKGVMLGAIALVLIGQLALAALPGMLWVIALVLLVYFTGFNVLEASQPSMVSKLSPGPRKGAAMGVYNTLQALGLFSGGAIGGWLSKTSGPHAVFYGASALVFVWLIIASRMKAPPVRQPV